MHKKKVRSGAPRRAQPLKKYCVNARRVSDAQTMEVSGRLQAAVLCEPSKAFSGQYMKAVRIDKVSMKNSRFILPVLYTWCRLYSGPLIVPAATPSRGSAPFEAPQPPRDASKLAGVY